MSWKVHSVYFWEQNRDICSVANGRTWTGSLDSRDPSWFNGLEWAKGRLRNCCEYDAVPEKKTGRERERERIAETISRTFANAMPMYPWRMGPHILNRTLRIGCSALTMATSIDLRNNNGFNEAEYKGNPEFCLFNLRNRVWNFLIFFLWIFKAKQLLNI